VPEDHLADLATRSPRLAARDAVVAALIQINLGSLMFTLSGCWAGHSTGSYPIGRASERADFSGGCSMASPSGNHADMAGTFRRLGRAYQAAAVAQRTGEALNWLKSCLNIER
jgi:hypothetical protein